MSLGRLASFPRVPLSALPTPLERLPAVPDGPRLWVKRDDLTGLGVGGNKARKLEFLCAQARDMQADCLVTVGAGQSNHCRMTAAAGARLGLETHLVLSGESPSQLTGNQALADLYGAHLHFTGEPSSHWGALEVARENLTEELRADGLTPYSVPIGGSTPVGALGYALAMVELAQQWQDAAIRPAAIVFTTSSGGTHAGLLAGQALLREAGHYVPDIVAIGVAKGVLHGMPDPAELAVQALAVLGSTHLGVDDLAGSVEIDGRWLGDDYGVPTNAADAAITWAGRHAGLVLDRTYSGKGCAGLLGQVADQRWSADDDVIFIHTGGLPAVFAAGGLPASPQRSGG